MSPRPALKRSQTPYTPSGASKRRRTCPTGAFSRLSLSPTERHDPPSTNTFHVFGAMNHDPSSEQASSLRETKMRSTYSAYEIDPNRIFIESLSDGEEGSPTTTTMQIEEEAATTRLEINPTIAHQYHQQQNQARNIFLNSYKFISSSSENDQQVVLYRKPIWPVLSSPSHPLSLPNSPDDLPRIVELDDVDDSNLNIDPMELD